MKTVLRFAALSFAVCSALGCGDSKPLLPKASGKAGEVIVVISRENWEGALGESVRGTLAADCPWLPTREPLYSVANVAPTAFGDLFKAHRNIVFFDINPAVTKCAVHTHHDKWAEPQCIIQVSARDDAQADSLFNANAGLIVNAIEQAERDRVVSSSRRYEKKGVYQALCDVFGGGLHVPTGYTLRKISDGFAWIEDRKQYTTQGIFVYRVPASGDADELTLPAILERRAEVCKSNVPGMFDGTYMITSEHFPPLLQYVNYKGCRFAQVNGLWEVEGDFMGGPFVSHSFYSPDGKYIIVCEAWVYAPRFDKRQYLRQTESILYTWQWSEK